VTAPAPIPMIFVNLPSTDIVRARAFYADLGFSFDERFCGSDSLMVTISDAIHLMILDREKFASLSPRPVAPEGTVSALHALSQPSASAVDAFAERALAHGGTSGDRMEQGDFMVSRDVFDPDGNGFAVMWMDVDRAMKAWGMAA
jgi:uncharacterized protein